MGRRSGADTASTAASLIGGRAASCERAESYWRPLSVDRRRRRTRRIEQRRARCSSRSTAWTVEYQRGRTLPVPPQRGQLPEPPQVTHLVVTHVPVFPRPPQAKHRVFPLHAPQTSSLAMNPSASTTGRTNCPLLIVPVTLAVVPGDRRRVLPLISRTPRCVTCLVAAVTDPSRICNRPPSATSDRPPRSPTRSLSADSNTASEPSSSVYRTNSATTAPQSGSMRGATPTRYSARPRANADICTSFRCRGTVNRRSERGSADLPTEPRHRYRRDIAILVPVILIRRACFREGSVEIQSIEPSQLKVARLDTKLVAQLLHGHGAGLRRPSRAGRKQPYRTSVTPFLLALAQRRWCRRGQPSRIRCRIL